MTKKKRGIFLLTILSLVFLISSTSATIETLGYFKQNSDVSLIQTCSSCTFNNISSILYPNTTAIFSDIAMTKVGVTYSYVLNGNYTHDFGRYIVCGFGDPSGVNATWCYDFFINATGRPEPSGAVLTFFIVSFLLILLFLVYLFVYSLGHAIQKNFDIVDLGFCMGIYFALLGLWFVHGQYIGNPLMESILSWLVYVGGVTHVFAPMVFFIISLFRASLEKSQYNMSGGMK
jgi:hypothetical protein